MAIVFFYHLNIILLICAWLTLAYNSKNAAFIMFIGLFIGRYSPTIVGLFFFFRRYQPSKPPEKPTWFAKDVTCIIPSIYDKEIYLSDLGECIKTSFQNSFAEIIIVTNSEATRKRIEDIETQVLNDLGKDPSCKRSNVNFQVRVCPVTNKREQLVIGIKAAKTELIVFADDHVFFKPQFVTDVTSVFENPLVGLCGTRKSVRRQALKATTFWGKYWERYWNFLGSTYLAQNDFRARCTNAADGGVNVVSGRALIVRRKIVQDPKFISKYLDERFFFGRFGPLNSDDDNFLTRWVTKEGWEIKIQDTYEATVETTLGQQHKFIGQCLRWARTTYRSNLCSLLTDRTVWWRQPWTVWLALIPTLFNLSFPWDVAIVYTFTQCEWYSRKCALLLCAFQFFFKCIKNMGHFYLYPKDFFLYFLIPLYLMFAWFHSFLKAYAALTFYVTDWTGRKLDSHDET